MKIHLPCVRVTLFSSNFPFPFPPVRVQFFLLYLLNSPTVNIRAAFLTLPAFDALGLVLPPLVLGLLVYYLVLCSDFWEMLVKN